MSAKKIGFIGLGLIGGSIAKAIKHFYPDYEILAYDVSRESLSLALTDKVIDSVCTGVDAAYKDCDYIFLCTPVSYNEAYLYLLKDIIKPDCLISDVGSVKSGIHRQVEKLSLSANFIGGHPMAGSEKSGFSHSNRVLIENAYYVLTPSKTVSHDRLEEFKNFTASLGSIPLVLDYEEHDYVTAAISHLPHIIASALVNLVKESDTREGLMKMIAAGGFKDITRIASSSPAMWQQICLTNRENITQVMDSYMKALEKVKDEVVSGDQDALYELFASSREYRNSIPNSSAGPIKKAYALYCDIIDEAGGIAAIATILAAGNVSIKNIGIVHNREFEEGVLRIEFYDEASSGRAAELLRKYRYTVYER